MLVTEENYRIWQKSLGARRAFRRWWQLWSNYAVIFFAGGMLFLLFQPQGLRILILMLVAFGISRLIVIEVINAFYRKQRPYQKYGFNPITSRLLSLQTTVPNSFPSRHTSSFAAASMVVFLFFPGLGLILLFATIMTGLGRIVLGYHYPEDILVGFILGAVVGLLTAYVSQTLPFT